MKYIVCTILNMSRVILYNFTLLILLIDTWVLSFFLHFMHIVMLLPSLTGGWANKLRPPGFPHSGTPDSRLYLLRRLCECVYVYSCTFTCSREGKSRHETEREVPPDAFIKCFNSVSVRNTYAEISMTISIKKRKEKTERGRKVWRLN